MPELTPVEHDPFTPMRMTPVEHDPFMVSPAVIDTMRSVPFDYGRQPDNAGPLARVGPLSQAQTDYARALINTPRIPGQTGGPSLEPVEPIWNHSPNVTEWVKGGLQDAMMAAGMDPYPAGHLAGGFTSIAGLTPFGIPMAAGDLDHAVKQGDVGGAIGAAVGLLPMAKGALTAAKGVASEVAPGIRAYHGSPHDFDRFSLEKIGTGEGAQAYGHGLYFAENEAVAKGYRNTLGGNALVAETPAEFAARDLIRRKGGYDAATEFAENRIAGNPDVTDGMHGQPMSDVLKLLKGGYGKTVPGKTYEVNIKADPERFLDWDKPLSEQSQHVQEAIKSIIGDGAFKTLRNEPARTVYNEVHPIAGRATGLLRDAGIPGIRYLDQGSRGAGNGTRNYVAFDDKMIDIIRKYGIAGLMGGAAAYGALGAGKAKADTPTTEPIDYAAGMSR